MLLRVLVVLLARHVSVAGACLAMVVVLDLEAVVEVAVVVAVEGEVVHERVCFGVTCIVRSDETCVMTFFASPCTKTLEIELTEYLSIVLRY